MGFVANFIRLPAVQNFEKRLIFDEVIESSKVGTFSETQCSSVLAQKKEKEETIAFRHFVLVQFK